MKRDITGLIRYLMDEWLPPALRDSPLLMKPLMRLFLKLSKNKVPFEKRYHFKKLALSMSEDEFAEVFDNIPRFRETDNNAACLERLLRDVKKIGGSVLDVGCGDGYVTEKLAEFSRAVGVDTSGRPGSSETKATYQKGSLHALPFEDSAFDCVVCSHTIEHVPDLSKCVSELRRVARKRLIITTPKQRPYYATFDTHIHFFPYLHSFLSAIDAPQCHVAEVLGGDIYYLEDLANGE